MEFINILELTRKLNSLKSSFHSRKPFKYVSFDGILHHEKAILLEQECPRIEEEKWDGTTYINQKNKFQLNKFEDGGSLSTVFKELNSKVFIDWLQEVTGIEEELIPDYELFGGGLHQSIKGAFLNVHVDYNFHHKTKFHRRLNVLIYLNQEWKNNYNGHLELWDMTQHKKKLLEKIIPSFNTCVIFETNEISYHGHPSPLNTPKDISRKSLAAYYYSKSRPENEVGKEHNTVYVNTLGFNGILNKIGSSIKALSERIKNQRKGR